MTNVKQTRVFKTKSFVRFAAREDIDDADLSAAVRRAETGQVDANLGGGVFKLRLARDGQGKSGGIRTIVLMRRGAIAFFVYGFAKSDRGNIRDDELKAFRRLATELLALSDAALVALAKNGTIVEIDFDG